MQRQLHQARTIQPEARIAAPEIGRAQKAFGNRHRVFMPVSQSAEVAQRHKPVRGVRPGPPGPDHRQPRPQAKRHPFGGLNLRFRIEMRAGGRDPMRRCRTLAKIAFGHPAAIAVPGRHHEDRPLVAVDDRDRFAQKQLPVARAAGAGAKVRQGHDHLRLQAFGQGCFHHARQRHMRHPTRKRCQPSVHCQLLPCSCPCKLVTIPVPPPRRSPYRFIISPRPSSTARAPWPAPPLGRDGWSLGVWP